MCRLLLLLLLAIAASAEPGWVSNVSYDSGPLKVTLVNYEQPKGKPFLIVHFRIQNPKDTDERCDWLSLVALQRSDGTVMAPNYDVLVDSGNGMTRATGPFVVPKRRKATASILFILRPGELPGRLILPDGRLSALIEQRGKSPWNP